MSKKPNTILLKRAQQWAKKWRRKEGHYNKHHEVHAFLIPTKDLKEVLMQDVDAVRAYLGIDEDNIEKLMIVGTKQNPKTGVYEDMLPNETGSLKGEVYDFTSPCPPMCDQKSPLN